MHWEQFLRLTNGKVSRFFLRVLRSLLWQKMINKEIVWGKSCGLYIIWQKETVICGFIILSPGCGCGLRCCDCAACHQLVMLCGMQVSLRCSVFTCYGVITVASPFSDVWRWITVSASDSLPVSSVPGFLFFWVASEVCLPGFRLLMCVHGSDEENILITIPPWSMISSGSITVFCVCSSPEAFEWITSTVCEWRCCRAHHRFIIRWFIHFVYLLVLVCCLFMIHISPIVLVICSSHTFSSFYLIHLILTSLFLMLICLLLLYCTTVYCGNTVTFPVVKYYLI